MKRIALFTFLLALTISAPASAQSVFDNVVGPFTYDEPTPVREILSDLSKERFKIQVYGLPPLENTYRGEIPRMKLSEIIDDILMPAVKSFAVMQSDDVLVIYTGHKSANSPRITPQSNIPSRSAPVPPSPPVTRSVLDYAPDPVNVIPIYQPSGGVLGMLPPPSRHISFSTSGYGYGWNGYPEPWLYTQHVVDMNTWGALKFKKGPERLMENIEVWGCGQKLAQADEGNNFWDHRVFVPVNCRPLTFRYTDETGTDWEVEIDEMIIPLRLQSAKNITLDKEFFNRARKRTEYLKYSLVEQPDGSFKRVPRR